ncbi:hypothetical protein [Streptomyces sp.]|uniref:hypothetical protein n=1 Tax=Streptomyces sp. TaxID=1931 RepID=UPI002F920367
MRDVLPEVSALPAEYQVRFTGLDTAGRNRPVTLSGMDLGEAVETCDHTQANQEAYQLPVDACIWCRIDGGPWHPWAGEGR